VVPAPYHPRWGSEAVSHLPTHHIKNVNIGMMW
jgi:hypothetical protein